MNFKKGTQVKILSGKDKGKKGKIIIIIRDNSAVIFLEFLSIFVMDKKKFWIASNWNKAQNKMLKHKIYLSRFSSIEIFIFNVGDSMSSTFISHQ